MIKVDNTTGKAQRENCVSKSGVDRQSGRNDSGN